MNSRYDGIGSVWRLSPVNTVIIAVNVLVFAYLWIMGNPADPIYMYIHGASYWPAIMMDHEYWRLLTSSFLHFDISHIFNNMLVLAYIGDNLERALGSVKYLIFYILCGLGSGAVSTLWSMITHDYAISGGASGAVFGVVGGLFIIVVMNKGHLEDMSSRSLGLFAVFSIYHGVTSVGVDNAAHIGGAVIGILLGLLMYRKKKYRHNIYETNDWRNESW